MVDRPGRPALNGMSELQAGTPAPRLGVPWWTARWLPLLASTLSFFVLWQTVAWAVHSPYLPGPAAVARALREALTSRDFLGFTIGQHVGSSLLRIVYGYTLAVVIAVPLGLLAGWFKPLETFLSPWIEMTRPIPPLAWIPFAIVFFGSPFDAVFIVLLASFFPIFLNTATGVKSVDPLLVDAGRTLGARGRFLFTRVVVPAASGHISAGLRLALGYAWMSIVAAEILGVKGGGLGIYLWTMHEVGRFDAVFAGMTIVGVLGLLLTRGVDGFARRLDARAGRAHTLPATPTNGVIGLGPRLAPAGVKPLAPKGLEIERLSMTFGGLEALRDVTLSVAPGEFVCVVGPSGCGKTTLLRVIAGLTPPLAGEVRANGSRLNGPAPERGVVFQEYALFPWLSVQQNVAFGLEARGVKRAAESEVVRDYVQLVGLAGFEHYRPNQLSGGMRQRAAIARALANQPAIMLMDEPFGSLDAQSRCAMQAELLRVWGQTRQTIIFVTHSVEEAVFLGDRVVVLSGRPGRVLEDVPIRLPRLRVRTSPEFNDLRAKIMAMI